MKRVAAYLRVSTREQLNGYGMDVQRRQLEEYMSANGVNLDEVDWFEDRGYSAKSQNRPAFKRLLFLIQNKEIKLVYIYKLDRMFRNIRDQIEILNKFMEYNCQLKCVLGNDVDYSSANGKMMLNIQGTLFQWELDTI